VFGFASRYAGKRLSGQSALIALTVAVNRICGIPFGPAIAYAKRQRFQVTRV
jgi:hypothetical protein